MIPTIPTEALPLLRGDYAVCYTESFARYIEKHSRLVAVQCGKEWLLVPRETWERVEADVRGIQREIDQC